MVNFNSSEAFARFKTLVTELAQGGTSVERNKDIKSNLQGLTSEFFSHVQGNKDQEVYWYTMNRMVESLDSEKDMLGSGAYVIEALIKDAQKLEAQDLSRAYNAAERGDDAVSDAEKSMIQVLQNNGPKEVLKTTGIKFWPALLFAGAALLYSSLNGRLQNKSGNINRQ